MQPFETPTSVRVQLGPAADGTASPTDLCAGLLLETMPRVMGALRTIMARPDISPFTVPQFRSLLYVHRHVGASLSETADFLGLTLPSASKLVDQLVKRGLLVRQHDPADRRRMTLRLTATGDALLKGAQATVRRQLATMLAAFSDAELAVLERALTLLHLSFPPPLGDPTHPFARPAAVADR